MEIENENNEKLTKEKEQEAFVKFRVKLAKVTHERFEKVQLELKKRGVEVFTASDYIQYILDNTEIDNKLIEQFTPLEYKLKKALLDENLRKKLEKLVSV